MLQDKYSDCSERLDMQDLCPHWRKMLTFIKLVVLLSCLSHIYGAESVATPKSFQDIFEGRCDEYQEVINPESFLNGLNRRKNCSRLWELFHEAFAFRDPCDVPVERYKEFVAAADHDMDTKNKVMYWSGSVYPLVYEYIANMRRYVTIRDTLSGYIIRNIDVWCGQKSEPGYNPTQCPPWGSCEDQATPTYWKAISGNFARKVEGHIDVLLNGSSGSAFRNHSTFAEYELVNLSPERNPSLSVLLIHNIDPSSSSARETCKNGSLVSLRGQVEQMNIAYNCTDDPVELTHFQCTDQAAAEACQYLAYSSAESRHSVTVLSLTAVICLTTSHLLP